MKRYRIDLSYDGSRYCGWQKQPNEITVQGELEKALSILFKIDIEIMGSGRTDSGVHAEHQVAHFDAPLIPDYDADRLLHSLRGLVNHDILVSAIQPVHPDFHSRFDALSRQYRYQLSTDSNVFRDRYTWVVKDMSNADDMLQTASIFIGEHDFSSFCKQNPDVNHNRCMIYESKLIQYTPKEWHYHIRANRFLHHMVRSIISAIVLVGRGKANSSDVSNWLNHPDKSNFSVKAPSHALFLEKVLYSE